MINTVTYEPAKFVNNILKKLRKSSYHIMNSYEFQTYVCTRTIPENYVMASFDVVSLFTNLPTEYMVEAMEDRWPEISTHTLLTKDEFFDLVRLILKQNYFSFDKKIYTQQSGLPMGSCMSPIGAEIALDKLLDTVTQWVYNELGVRLCVKKYVDDLWLELPANLTNEILSIFNSADINIQFTIEIEKNGCLPFLDMVVIRNIQNGTITTRWHKKSIASGRMIHYHSVHPYAQKIGTAIGFIDRVFKLSSTHYHQEEKREIIEMLKTNGYPKRLTNILISKYCQKSKHSTLNNNNNNTSNVYFSIPYIEGVSEKIARLLRPHIDGATIAFKNRQRLEVIYSKLKDKIENENRSNIVYQIECLNCDNKQYIGNTSQMLKGRIAGHKSDCNHQYRDKCVVVAHSMDHNHRFDFENVKILTEENKEYKRNLLEELYIKSSETCINSKSKEAKNISNIYNYLFEYLKQQ